MGISRPWSSDQAELSKFFFWGGVSEEGRDIVQQGGYLVQAVHLDPSLFPESTKLITDCRAKSNH